MAGALSSEGRSFLKLVFGVETLGAPPPGVWAREAGRLLCTLLKLLVCNRHKLLLSTMWPCLTLLLGNNYVTKIPSSYFNTIL